MIQIAEGLWIGNASVVETQNLKVLRIDAILNVAQDLQGKTGWPDVEYMQVGLVDGPGNPLTAYYAAVFALETLFERHKQVVVCCHSGSRSIAVALMYLNVIVDRGWPGWLNALRERVDVDLPVSHEAHQVAFKKMDWKFLRKMV